LRFDLFKLVLYSYCSEHNVDGSPKVRWTFLRKIVWSS